jgi:hypothetical protein
MDQIDKLNTLIKKANKLSRPGKKKEYIAALEAVEKYARSISAILVADSYKSKIEKAKNSHIDDLRN